MIPRLFRSCPGARARSRAVRRAFRFARERRAPADLVVTGGKVLTVDAGFRVAEAVAIRDGVFVLVGTNAQARALVGPQTRVIDAGGKTVIPGLIDSHVHALGVAEAEARGGFRDLRTIAEIQAWLREKTAAVPEGQWIFSPRVFPTRLAERRLPTRAELDAAAPRHPVVVDAAYALMVNTAALQAAGIGPDTPSPRGGAIVKDEQGRPTGLLRNVGGLLDRFQSPRRPERLLPALEAVHRRYNEAGITSVIERAADLAGYRAYAQLRAQGRPRVRATVTLRVDSDGTVEGTEAFLRSLPLRLGRGGRPAARGRAQDLRRRRHPGRDRLHARAVRAGGGVALRRRRSVLPRAS